MMLTLPGADRFWMLSRFSRQSRRIANGLRVGMWRLAGCQNELVTRKQLTNPTDNLSIEDAGIPRNFMRLYSRLVQVSSPIGGGCGTLPTRAT